MFLAFIGILLLRDLWSQTQGRPRLECPWPSFEPGSYAYGSYACRFLEKYLHILRFSYVTFGHPHTGSTTLVMSGTLIRTRFECICFICMCMHIFRIIHSHFTFCPRDLWSPTQGQPRLVFPWPSFEPGSDAHSAYACRFLETFMHISHLAFWAGGIVGKSRLSSVAFLLGTTV